MKLPYSKLPVVGIAALAVMSLTGWGDRHSGPPWPHSGAMPDDPVKVKPFNYTAIDEGSKSYRPIAPMPWGDVNRRVAPPGSLPPSVPPKTGLVVPKAQSGPPVVPPAVVPGAVVPAVPAPAAAPGAVTGTGSPSGPGVPVFDPKSPIGGTQPSPLPAAAPPVPGAAAPAAPAALPATAPVDPAVAPATNAPLPSILLGAPSTAPVAPSPMPVKP